MTRSNEEENQIAAMVKSGHALPTQSDAGAHLNTNFCTAGESSYVLGQWVRDRELLTLEDAIRRYTFQPARIMGLRDRGMIREGLAADLMVFDLASIGIKEDEVTHDGPSGTPRRVQGADGVSHVIVGGQVVLEHGKHTGALPGRVLRAGREHSRLSHPDPWGAAVAARVASAWVADGPAGSTRPASRSKEAV